MCYTIQVFILTFQNLSLSFGHDILIFFSGNHSSPNFNPQGWGEADPTLLPFSIGTTRIWPAAAGPGPGTSLEILKRSAPTPPAGVDKLIGCKPVSAIACLGKKPMEKKAEPETVDS